MTDTAPEKPPGGGTPGGTMVAGSARGTNGWLVESGQGAAAWNMAVDEALLEAVGGWGRPVLRFYGWTEPAASFGYSQRYIDVLAMTPLRPVIRRPTGGGIVPHNADWTYALVIPPDHEWYQLRARESYYRVHAWVADAFRVLGLEVVLAPESRTDAPGQCFAGAEEADLLWRGRKIAGAAQRRNKLGLLIQGSIQPPSVLQNQHAFQAAMLDVARWRWGWGWTEMPAGEFPRSRASELAREKYEAESYRCRR
jgi:lipoyl(octanoyl) transferase